jgi:hypothetical protein
MSTNFIIPHAIQPLTSISCANINQRGCCYCHCIKLLYKIATFGMRQCYCNRYNTCHCRYRGLTSIFITRGTPVNNLRQANHPITVSSLDGNVSLTHIYDIIIHGTPTILTGHIIPGITMASLISIRILCTAGCKVTFDNKSMKYSTKSTLFCVVLKTPPPTYGPYHSPPTRLQRPPQWKF